MSIFKLRANLAEKIRGFGNNFHPALKKPLEQLNLVTKSARYSLSKVLSIDDNKVCQKINLTHLENLGCFVELVDTARAALEKLVSPYKIIFLDVNLPDCSSDVLINLIRNDESNINKDTPIIVTSSWLNESLKKNYLNIGVNEVYIKPIIELDFKKILQAYGLIV